MILDALVLFGLVCWINLIFSFCKKEHTKGFNKTTKIGRFEVWVGIAEPQCRDFDFNLSFCPFHYATFAISLWTFYFNVVWDRNIDQYPDCGNDNNIVCYGCGRKLEKE